MNYNTILIIQISLCLCFVLGRAGVSHSQNSQLNCYYDYKRAGDEFFRLGQFDQAELQYKAASKCDNCAGRLIPEIDSLLEMAQLKRVEKLQEALAYAQKSERIAREALATARQKTREALANDLAFRSQNELSGGNRTTALRYGEYAWQLDTANNKAARALFDAYYYNELHPRGEAKLWSFPLEGHANFVTSADFSSDGRQVITSDYYSARTWDANAGLPLAVFSVTKNYLISASFSPDGKNVLLQFGDGSVSIWDDRFRQELLRVNLKNFITSFAGFSTDGRFLLLANREGEVRVLDARTGLESNAFRFTQPADRKIEFFKFEIAPDSQRILLLGESAAFIWNYQQADTLQLSAGIGHRFFDASFSPDGKYFAMISDSTFGHIRDIETGRPLIYLNDNSWVSYSRRIRFTPDGGQVATYHSDGSIKFWDRLSGQKSKELSLLKLKQQSYPDFRFSPAANKLLIYNNGISPTVWDLETRQLSPLLNLRNGFLQFIEVTKDGRYLFMLYNYGNDKERQAEVWDLERREKIATWSGRFLNNAYAGQLSPDGRFAFMELSGNEIAVLDLQTRKVYFYPVVTQEYTYPTAFVGGDKLLVKRGDVSVVWHFLTGELENLDLNFNWISSSPDSRYSFFRDERNLRSGYIYDHNRQMVTDTIKMVASAIFNGWFSPDNQHLFFSMSNGNSMGWYDRQLQKLQFLPLGARDLKFRPDAKAFVASGEDLDGFSYWQFQDEKWKEVAKYPLPGLVDFNFSDDQDLLVYHHEFSEGIDSYEDILISTFSLGNPGIKLVKNNLKLPPATLHSLRLHNHGVVWWDNKGLQFYQQSDDSTNALWTVHSNAILNSHLSRDGRLLITVSGQDGAIVWDLEKQRALQQFGSIGENAFQFMEAGFSDDSRLLYLFGMNQIQIFDLDQGREIKSLPLPFSPEIRIGQTLNSAAFSPQGGKYLAYSYGQPDVFLRGGLAWEDQKVLEGHSAAVNSLAFSPDGRYLATASEDKSVKVWDVAGGQYLFTLEGHSGAVLSVAFSPDGSRLASGAEDGTTVIWDMDSRMPVFNLRRQDKPVASVVFSADGSKIMTADLQTSLSVWDAHTGVLSIQMEDSEEAEITEEARNEEGIGFAHLGPGGDYVYTVSRETGIVRAWDLSPSHIRNNADRSGRVGHLTVEQLKSFNLENVISTDTSLIRNLYTDPQPARLYAHARFFREQARDAILLDEADFWFRQGIKTFEILTEQLDNELYSNELAYLLQDYSYRLLLAGKYDFAKELSDRSRNILTKKEDQVQSFLPAHILLFQGRRELAMKAYLQAFLENPWANNQLIAEFRSFYNRNMVCDPAAGRFRDCVPGKQIGDILRVVYFDQVDTVVAEQCGARFPANREALSDFLAVLDEPDRRFYDLLRNYMAHFGYLNSINTVELANLSSGLNYSDYYSVQQNVKQERAGLRYDKVQNQEDADIEFLMNAILVLEDLIGQTDRYHYRRLLEEMEGEMASTYGATGRTYLEEGRRDLAYQNLQKSMDVYEEMNRKYEGRYYSDANFLHSSIAGNLGYIYWNEFSQMDSIFAVAKSRVEILEELFARFGNESYKQAIEQIHNDFAWQYRYVFMDFTGEESAVRLEKVIGKLKEFYQTYQIPVYRVAISEVFNNLGQNYYDRYWQTIEKEESKAWIEKSIAPFKEALTWNMSESTLETLFSVSKEAASRYAQDGDYQKASAHLDEGLGFFDLAESNNMLTYFYDAKARQGECLRLKAWYCLMSSAFPMALEAAKKAVRIAKTPEADRMLAHAFLANGDERSARPIYVETALLGKYSLINELENLANQPGISRQNLDRIMKMLQDDRKVFSEATNLRLPFSTEGFLRAQAADLRKLTDPLAKNTQSAERTYDFTLQLNTIRQEIFGISGNPPDLDSLVFDMDRLAFYSLVVGKYRNAIKISEEAVNDRQGPARVRRNQAFAYLFLNQWKEADAIFRDIMDLPDPYNYYGTVRDAMRMDLTYFEQHQITHPDLARVKQMVEPLGALEINN